MRTAAVSLLCVALLPGCFNLDADLPDPGAMATLNSPLSDRVGERCTVRLRHDALGTVKTDDSAFPPAVITGTLLEATADWLSISVEGHDADPDGAEYHIPRESILVLTFDEPAAEPEATEEIAPEQTEEIEEVR